MALSREDILSADDLKREKHSVPEWGGDVYLSVMGGDDREVFEGINEKREAGNASELDVLASLLAFTLTDEHGNKLFSLEDLEALKCKSAAVLVRLGTRAANLNAITADDIEDLKGN